MLICLKTSIGDAFLGTLDWIRESDGVRARRDQIVSWPHPMYTHEHICKVVKENHGDTRLFRGHMFRLQYIQSSWKKQG